MRGPRLRDRAPALSRPGGGRRMAANAIAPHSPRLWDATRHELFKGRKQRFYVVVVLLPLIVALAITLIGFVVKILSPPTGGVPELGPGSAYDLGPGGTFAN